jgi:hypothetical protein
MGLVVYDEVPLKFWNRPHRNKEKVVSMSISISHSAICLTPVLTFNWHFVFGAVKCDWLLILAPQTTFNLHYFFFVALVLAINSLPYTAAMYHRQKQKNKFCFFLLRVKTF